MSTSSPLDPVIVSAVRTPIGRVSGALAPVRADYMFGLVLAEAVKRAKIDGGDVDEVFAGCANQAGEDNRNVARMGALLAGLPQSVPGVTVNRLCASGLEAVVQASRMIRVEEARVCLASGVENMSRAPYVMGKAATGYAVGAPATFDTSLGWRFPNPKMAALFPLEQMGETAENLVEEHHISREDQDAFALRSHQKAIAAMNAGAFDAEYMEVSIPQRKGADVVVSRDEGPRAETTLENSPPSNPRFARGAVSPRETPRHSTMWRRPSW